MTRDRLLPSINELLRHYQGLEKSTDLDSTSSSIPHHVFIKSSTFQEQKIQHTIKKGIIASKHIYMPAHSTQNILTSPSPRFFPPSSSSLSAPNIKLFFTAVPSRPLVTISNIGIFSSHP